MTPGGTPNVYELPRPELGFNFSKSFGAYDHVLVRFTATNILNSQFKQVYQYGGVDYTFGAYQLGRTFSLSLKYTFDKEKRDDLDNSKKTEL